VLPAENRLRRRRDFTLTVRGGRRVRRRFLVVHVRGDEVAADSPPRAGVIVSRNVGSAVARNRVKRRLRHLLADRMARLPAGIRLVVRALPASADASSASLAADLDRALQSAGSARRESSS
jgi:ribonuclease P protein component